MLFPASCLYRGSSFLHFLTMTKRLWYLPAFLPQAGAQLFWSEHFNNAGGDQSRPIWLPGELIARAVRWAR
jgi:hypothetical protein